MHIVLLFGGMAACGLVFPAAVPCRAFPVCHGLRHGLSRVAMACHGLPWFVMACSGLPRLAVACDGLPWRDCRWLPRFMVASKEACQNFPRTMPRIATTDSRRRVATDWVTRVSMTCRGTRSGSPWHAVGLISWDTAGVRMAHAMVLPWPAIWQVPRHVVWSQRRVCHGLPRLAKARHGKPHGLPRPAAACQIHSHGMPPKSQIMCIRELL